jgi:hypothetical protein
LLEEIQAVEKAGTEEGGGGDAEPVETLRPLLEEIQAVEKAGTEEEAETEDAAPPAPDVSSPAPSPAAAADDITPHKTRTRWKPSKK